MRPLLVGLTGNFGTGKSTAAGFFRKAGAQVVSTDKIAHEVFQKGNPLHSRLRRLFPELKGSLRREKIAVIVFRSRRRRKRLESLVHPYVFNRIQQEIRRTRKRIMILEVPLLFESGFYRRCDLNILVQAPFQRTLQRLRRQGFSRTQVEARWRAQWPSREKAGRADFLIDNSDGLRNTRRQTQRIWKLLQKIERSLARNAKGKS